MIEVVCIRQLSIEAYRQPLEGCDQSQICRRPELEADLGYRHVERLESLGALKPRNLETSMTPVLAAVMQLPRFCATQSGMPRLPVRLVWISICRLTTRLESMG